MKCLRQSTDGSLADLRWEQAPWSRYRPVPSKVLDQLRLKAYVRGVVNFLIYNCEQIQGIWKHLAEMGNAEIDEYLTWLAV